MFYILFAGLALIALGVHHAIILDLLIRYVPVNQHYWAIPIGYVSGIILLWLLFYGVMSYALWYSVSARHRS